MTANDIDFDVTEFARILARLEEHLEISDAFENADPQKDGRWWTSQREHMTSWFRAQATTGSGKYTRNEPNHSAKVTYNRLQSPEGLLWIAEALGADTGLVQAVADEALATTRGPSQCAAIRRHLPWAVIAELAQSRQGRWRRWISAARSRQGKLR